MWGRRDVDFIQSQDVSWSIAPTGEFAAGEMTRILSRDDSDGAVTEIVRFHNRQAGYLVAGADIYILEGDGTLNGERVAGGQYVYLPAGVEIDWRPGTRMTAFFGSFAEPTLSAVARPGDRGEPRIVAPDLLPWIPAGWADEGTLDAGAAMKWLRSDTGPGLVLLSGMLPGWKSEKVESHPIFEESFKLVGDILMGARGVMRPGAYFYRPPNVAHGPLYSRSGTMSLIRWSQAATTTFTEPSIAWDRLADIAYGSMTAPALRCHE